MTDEYDTEQKSNIEPTEDQSMEGAFDFDEPGSDLETVSDEEGDDDSALGNGDDDSANPQDDTEDQEDQESQDEGTIDPKLLVRVGRMGLSDEETDKLLELGSSKAITSMLDMLESRKGQSTSRDGKADNPSDAEWYEISEDMADEFAPELVEVLQAMNGSTRKVVEQLMGSYEQRIQAMSNELSNNAFEDAIESLGKDWEPVIGKDANVEQLREAVFSDKYKGSIAKRVKAATKDIFTEHTNKIANNTNVQKARKRQGQFIGRSSHRSKNDADMSKTQIAVANATSFMKEHGMYQEYMGGFDTNEDL